MRKKICVPTIYPIDRDMNKRWYVRLWYFEGFKPKRINIWIPSEKTLELRMIAAQAIIGKGYKPLQKLSSFVPTDAHFIIKLLFDELDLCKASLRKKSFQTYKSHFSNFQRYLKESKTKQVDNEVAKAFLLHLHQIGRGGRTINAHRITFNIFFNRMVEGKKIKENPFKNTKRVAQQSVGSQYFKTNQIEELKKYITEHCHFLWLPIQFMYYCYIRPGELRNLKIADIDFDDWQIKIRSDISKNRKEQFVAIPDGLKFQLVALGLHQKLSNSYVFGVDGVLGSETQVGQNYWSYKHLKMLRDLNYSEAFNLYSWKHTGVVRAYKAGIGLKELQMQLRHHSLDMVKIYLESLGILDFKNIKELFPVI
jgi:integrase